MVSPFHDFFVEVDFFFDAFAHFKASEAHFTSGFDEFRNGLSGL